MGIDTSETLAQRAAQSLVDLNEAILEGSGDLAVECAAVITALSVANAQLERERDEARASVATCQAFVAARGTNRDYQQARAEKAEAERDAATAALAKAEGERDSMPRYRHVKRGTIYEIVLRCCLQLDGEHDMSPMVVYRDVADGSLWTRRQSEFFDGRFEALTPAPEAPNAAVREAGSALWTEDHRQKMAQEASAILDEMRQGAPKDGE